MELVVTGLAHHRVDNLYVATLEPFRDPLTQLGPLIGLGRREDLHAVVSGGHVPTSFGVRVHGLRAVALFVGVSRLRAASAYA